MYMHAYTRTPDTLAANHYAQIDIAISHPYNCIHQKRDVVLRKFFSSNGNSNARSDVNVDSGVSSGGVWRLHLIEDGRSVFADDEKFLVLCPSSEVNEYCSE